MGVGRVDLKPNQNKTNLRSSSHYIIISNMLFQILFSVLLFTASATRLKLKDEPVSNLCDSTVKSLSGYFSVSEEYSKNYFFWFFESRSAPSTDPLVIWLTGGPGCSSQLALLSENGPCKVTEDGLNTVNNPYSWNNNANILWVDQPARVGYSYGALVDHNETEVAEDMYHFVQEFLKAHPEYAKLELFVFGESYGGKCLISLSFSFMMNNMSFCQVTMPQLSLTESIKETRTVMVFTST